MIDTLLTPVYSFLGLYTLWVFYLAVMNLKRVRDTGKMTKTALVLGMPILYVGYALDVAINLLVLTVLLVEVPKEFTVTARLKRHKKGEGWRKPLAIWIGDNLLDAYDPDGKHL